MRQQSREGLPRRTEPTTGASVSRSAAGFTMMFALAGPGVGMARRLVVGSWCDSWTSRMTVVCQALGMREILRGMRVRNHRPRRLVTVLFHTRETLVP